MKRISNYFWIAVVVSAIPHLYAAFDGISSSNATFSLWALGWGVSPIVVAIVMAMARARAAAWGWLAAVAAFGYFVFATVFVWPQSSTAPLALLWAPLWSFVIVGPIGAGLGILVSLRYEAG